MNIIEIFFNVLKTQNNTFKLIQILKDCAENLLRYLFRLMNKNKFGGGIYVYINYQNA